MDLSAFPEPCAFRILDVFKAKCAPEARYRFLVFGDIVLNAMRADIYLISVFIFSEPSEIGIGLLMTDITSSQIVLLS